jgi:hypothetical protein
MSRKIRFAKIVTPVGEKWFIKKLTAIHIWEGSVCRQENILTSALDSIFSYSFTPKHFTADKYEQRDHEADIYRLNKTTYANVKELRIQMAPSGPSTDLIIYIHSNSKDTAISNNEREFFVHRLFGEEILLKKINSVKFKFSDSIQSSLLTLDETLLKLNR